MTCPFCGAKMHSWVSRPDGNLNRSVATVYTCGTLGQETRIGERYSPERLWRADDCKATPWIDSCRTMKRGGIA